jgi:inhibitor of cysteine peptidase
MLIGTACGPTQPAQPGQPAGSDDAITGQALIESIVLVTLESFPVQVRVNVKGSLPDACTAIGETQQSIEGNLIRFDIFTTRPADAQCAQVVTPFEQTFALDVLGLLAGTYTVNVNGVTDTFTLAVDNALQTDPVQVCPAPSDEQQAFLSEADRYCFVYPAGFELAQPGGGLIVVSGPAVGDGTAATLTIQNEGAAGGRTTDEVAAQKLYGLETGGVAIIRGNVYLGDEEAIVADGVPGVTSTRQAYLVYQDTVFVLTLSPLDDSVPQVADDMERLWETVVSSWKFIASAAAPATIPWPDAESLILSGAVRQIFQAHSLEVRMTLQDGREVVTVEPSIDEVFRVVDRCGAPCAGIALATE